MANGPDHGDGSGDEASCLTDEHEPVPRVPAAPEEIAQAARFFRALGDQGRLTVLIQLAQGERCVTDLASELEEEMSTVSQRLRALRAEHLVSRRRDGKHIYYRLADAHVQAIVDAALEHAREG